MSRTQNAFTPINLTRLVLMSRITEEKRKKSALKKGYVTEIKAGNYIQRTVTNVRPKGGCPVTWLYESWEEINQTTGETTTHTARTGEYLVNSTGEVKQQKETAKKRIDNMRNVRIACERFKWKLRANAHNAHLFITLTYAENMTDTAQLYDDFRKFWQKFKRLNGCANAGYLVAFEPQERGAWHAHIVTVGGAKYVPNETIARLWAHGYSKTTNCRNIADLGGYLTSYLVNLAPSAEDSEEQKASKKNARLPLYPARFRFLRWSKGLADAETTTSNGFKEPAEKEIKGYVVVKDKTSQYKAEQTGATIYTRYILYISTRQSKKIKKMQKNKKYPLQSKNNNYNIIADGENNLLLHQKNLALLKS